MNTGSDFKEFKNITLFQEIYKIRKLEYELAKLKYKGKAERIK